MNKFEIVVNSKAAYFELKRCLKSSPLENPREAIFLVILKEAFDNPVNMGDVIKSTDYSNSDISHLSSKLRGKGLLRKYRPFEKNETYRGQKLLKITKKGMATVEEIKRIIDKTNFDYVTFRSNSRILEFYSKINWPLLFVQKKELIESSLPEDTKEGLLALLDELQDIAVDELGYSEKDVFCE